MSDSQKAEAVKKSKKYVSDAGEIVASLKKEADAAAKLQKEGKELDDIQKVLAGFKFLSKVSTVFQIVTVALTVAEFFHPTKSDEEKILEAIDEVNGRVRALSSDIRTQLEQLSLHDEVFGAKATLAGPIADIEDGMDIMQSIVAVRRKGEAADFESVQNHKLIEKDYSSALRLIYDFSTGTGVANNFLAKLHEATFGNVQQVHRMAEYIITMSLAAVICDSFKSALLARRNHKDDHTEFTEVARIRLLEQTVDFHESRLAEISKNAVSWSKACIDKEAISAQIERYFYFSQHYPMAVISLDRQGSADRIVDEMTKKWPYLAFSAIVYDPVSGFNNHAMQATSKHSHHFYRQLTQDGHSLNIIIYWAKRKKDHKVKRIRPPSFQPLVVQGRYFDSKEKHWRATYHMFDKINDYPKGRSGLRAWWNLDRVDNISKFFDVYKKGLSASKPGLYGSLIWGMWIERDSFNVGFTSDNPALLVSSAKHFQISAKNAINVTNGYHRVISIWPA